MNIWILNHYVATPDIPGGTRHFDFARELTKRGHSVCIFASGFRHRTRQKEKISGNQIYQREHIDGVKFVWINTFSYQRNDWRRVINMLSYVVCVIPLSLRMREKPDTIIASSPHLFTGIAGWIIARLKRTQFILEIRDLWPQTFVEIGGYSNRSLIVIILRIIEKFLYQKADKIIILPPMATEYITKLGIPEAKIYWIPNGVSPEIFSKPGILLSKELVSIIEKLRIDNSMVIGYTGAHGIANTLDTILRAAEWLQEIKFNSAHFLLVGDGPEKKNLISNAKSQRLKNVHFCRAIPKNMIPELLRSIDIAVLPRRKSGLGKYGISTNKLFDYMAAARPIVWGTNSENNPVAEAGCGITVPPEDPKELAKAIIKIYKLAMEDRQEMGNRGYSYVMKYHSIPVLVNKLLDAIEDNRVNE